MKMDHMIEEHIDIGEGLWAWQEPRDTTIGGRYNTREEAQAIIDRQADPSKFRIYEEPNRAREADAIAKALAECSPLEYVPSGHECTLCGHVAALIDQVKHADSCPWLRARKYVSR